MTIAVQEKVESRETGKESGEWEYTITGTADQDAARAALYAAAEGQCGTWQIDNYQVEPVSIDSGNPDDCIWKGIVSFVPAERKERDPLEVGESSYNFDTGGGSQHITHIKDAAHHIATYPAAGAFDPEGLIGVTNDGSVEGCDIRVPVYNWGETHIIPDALLTDEYKGKLYELTGRTNNAVFKGFAIGECLFCGASGSQRGDDDWEITFRWASSPNWTETIKVDGVDTEIAKKGWEYLWVRTTRGVNNDEIGPMVRSVYVEQVYESGDFGDLGIGD